jgi:MFS family permease
MPLASMLPARNTLTALAQPDFRRFFVGNATSLLGDGMAGVAISFAVIHLTGSAADLGYVLSARSFSVISTLIFGGVIADRFPRLRVMITADLARFLTQAATATLLVTGHALLWELMLLQAALGAGSAIFNPAVTGLMPSLVGSGMLQQANALRGLAMSAGYIAGPAAAGIIVTAASPGWAIAVDAATFAVSASQLARLRPRAAASPSRASFLRDLRNGWTELRAHTWLWTFVVSCSFNNACYSAFLVLGPAVTARSHDGAAQWATLLAALGIGSLLGGAVAIRIQPRRPLLAAALAVALFPLPTLGLAARAPIIAVAVLCVLAGAGTTVSNTLQETTVQRHVRPDALSRISAFELMGSLASQPVGQTAAGPLAMGVGVFPALWVAGCAQMLNVLGILTVPAIRRLSAWPTSGSPERSSSATAGVDAASAGGCTRRSASGPRS